MAVYFNNAATTYPKPAAVAAAMARELESLPREMGRAAEGNDSLAICRQEVAAILGVADPRQVILVPSATQGLNLVIQGLLSPGKAGSFAPAHVITSVLEHNSVLRPLKQLAGRGWIVPSLIRPCLNGCIGADAVRRRIRRDTRLVALTHASNVTGWVQPVEDIAQVCAERDIPMLIDALQTAGAVPIRFKSLPGRVFVVAAGHKGLFGPMGTGVLIVPDARLAQTIVGGTGVDSRRLEIRETYRCATRRERPTFRALPGSSQGSDSFAGAASSSWASTGTA